jgi:hypothetical protein
MRASVVVAAFLLSAVLVPGVGSGAAPNGLGRFLLVYSTCDTTPCSGETTVRLAQSRDGVRWSAVPSFVPAAGTDPSAVRRGNTLYVLDSLQVAATGLTAELRRFTVSTAAVTEATASPVTVTLPNPAEAQAAGGLSGSLAVDANGLLVLVYVLRFEPGAPGCPATQPNACLRIRTATEVAGTDGAEFAGDAGSRRSLSFAPTESAGGPSVFANDNGYAILLAGPGRCLKAFAATDLHGTYRAAPGLPGSCLTDPADVTIVTPSGAYRPALKESWIYLVRDGTIVRAITSKLTRRVPATRFRTVKGFGDPPVATARFLLNTP